MGNLADALSLTLNIAVDALADCALDPVKDAFIYHSPYTPGPQQCCDDNAAGHGFMASWWDPVYVSDGAGRPRSDVDAPALPAAAVYLRLWRCFPVIASDGTFDISAAATRSEGIADDTECITRALIRSACGSNTPAALNYASEIPGCQHVDVINAKPVRPQGGCAGVTWSLAMRFTPVASP